MLNDSTVIKPLNIRELHFYQNIPEDIQNFVPRYKGEHYIPMPLWRKINARSVRFYDSLNASCPFIASYIIIYYNNYNKRFIYNTIVLFNMFAFEALRKLLIVVK